jgi:hypothetical protein
MRLGILPAAGKADRWGGYPKELLPISNTHTFLSRSVESLLQCGCDLVMVVTNPAKIHLHAYHLRDWDRVLFSIQQGDEMWAAMTTALDTPADEYYFMMPDTFLPDRPFPPTVERDFGLGVFLTDQPERFGVFRGNEIVNKQPSSTPGLAWGVLAWKKLVADYWRTNAYSDYTSAINGAIREYSFSQWHLDYYYDMGSMDHYAEFLLNRHEVSNVLDLDSPLVEVLGRASRG